MESDQFQQAENDGQDLAGIQEELPNFPSA